jgi:hypothetical protein
MIVARPKDRDLIEETLELDSESRAFDPKLRMDIRRALDALEVGTAAGGKKIVVRADDDDWDLLAETLYMDTRSKRFDPELRDDLEAVLDRLVVKPWPGRS